MFAYKVNNKKRFLRKITEPSFNRPIYGTHLENSTYLLSGGKSLNLKTTKLSFEQQKNHLKIKSTN